MASTVAFQFPALLALAFLTLVAGNVHSQLDPSSSNLMTDALDLPASLRSYTYPFDPDEDDDLVSGDTELLDGWSSFGLRRSLFWRQHLAQYYISYGALVAGRVPCPPRSGRSYYTHNCYLASGPVCPYTRGCSAITRCRR